MLNFKTIEILEPNTEILEIIKSYSYKTKNGKIQHLLKTNLSHSILKNITKSIVSKKSNNFLQKFKFIPL